MLWRHAPELFRRLQKFGQNRKVRTGLIDYMLKCPNWFLLLFVCCVCFLSIFLFTTTLNRKTVCFFFFLHRSNCHLDRYLWTKFVRKTRWNRRRVFSSRWFEDIQAIPVHIDMGIALTPGTINEYRVEKKKLKKNLHNLLYSKICKLVRSIILDVFVIMKNESMICDHEKHKPKMNVSNCQKVKTQKNLVRRS